MKTSLKTLLTGAATIGLMAMGLSVPAWATGPAVSIVDTNDTLSGSTISGYGSSTTLRLAVVSTMGTVTWNNNGSGANLVSNAGSTAQGIWLEGTQDQLNAAMAEISVNKPCAGSYKIYAEVSDSGYLQDPVTGHLYQHSPSVSGFTDAIAAAQATPLVPGGTNTFGYMATVTSTLENIIVSNFMTQDDWLGASDSAVEGDWTWLSGPEAGTVFYRGQGDQNGQPVNGGYNNWNPGEPNNSGGTEDIAQIYSNGFWNDITDGARYYTIEWGGMAGDDLSSVVVPSDSIDVSVAGAFAGSGTQADPYLIPDATALHAVSGCGSDAAYFEQTADITLPDTWAGDQNFKGHYDGNDKKIQFSANTPITHNQFGVWAYSENGQFTHMDVSGDLDAGSHNQVGLLMGNGYGSIENSTFSGSITSDHGWDIGSVAGEGGTNLNYVTSTVNFNATSGGEVGGLVGYYWGALNQSSWNGTMQLSADIEEVGGLVGTTDCASIYASHAVGAITNQDGSQNIGGLAGYFCGETYDSWSNVDINTPNANNVGGLAGHADGNFYRVAAYGNINGGDTIGGAFGWASYNEADDVVAHGNITSTYHGGSIVGGIESFSLYRAYGTGTVTAPSSRGAIGSYYNPDMGNVHWVPEQSTITVPTDLLNGEVPYTTADSKAYDYYNQDGWNISTNWTDNATWTICSGYDDGYPFLTSLHATDPCDPALTNATAPTITGSGVEGKPLAIDKGAWDSGVTFTYQWKLDGNNIAGATAATYTPVAGDVGKTVTMQLTGTKAHFKTEAKLSTNSVVISAAPVIVIPVVTNTEIAVGTFAGNSWWIPVGYVAAIKAAVKAHAKATAVTCTGIVAPGGNKAWQQKLGLKRATLACAVVKTFNSKLKTKLAWRVAAAGDKVQRGSALKFNK